MRGNRKAQNSEPAKEKLHIGIFAGIAVLAFLLTAVFYGIGFFPFQSTHSDGNGYYMYLPAFFVYHDPGMHFLDQLAEDISGFSGTFFPMDTGQVVDKYTMGVAILQLPFFLAADILTKLFRPEAADGFSALYQLGNITSGCFYYFFGSFWSYRLAKKYAGAGKAFAAVLLITFGTGLFHYITMDGSYSHVYTYGMLALFLWLVERHEEEEHTKFKVLGGICFGLVTLIRVTNVVVIFVYLLYRVTSWKSFRERMAKVLRPKRFLPILAGFFPVWLPQLIYWKWAAGSFIVNSYDLPGNIWQEHFNWLQPQIAGVLFLPNRGVFFWCPVVILSCAAFVLCFRRAENFQPGMLVSVILFTYITAAWWAYDGFCGFTNRFFVDLSPIFIFELALFLGWARERRRIWILTIVFLTAALIWINLFMIEYWHNSTTMFQVTWESIGKVFGWYRKWLSGL